MTPVMAGKIKHLAKINIKGWRRNKHRIISDFFVKKILTKSSYL
jgi:hypothetical protein